MSGSRSYLERYPVGIILNSCCSTSDDKSGEKEK